MWARLSIVAGLVVGVAVAGLVLGGIVAFAPGPPPPSTPAPSLAAATPVPSATATAAASAAPSGSSGDGAFHIGQRAPALSVPQVGGGTIDLATLAGKPVWLTFMATSCEACLDEFPARSDFATRYADAGLVVVAVDVGEDEGAVAAVAEQLGVSFPMGLDTDGTAARAWGADTLPVHVWIDADGIVRASAPGGIGPDAVAAALEKILPGVDVTP